MKLFIFLLFQYLFFFLESDLKKLQSLYYIKFFLMQMRKVVLFLN